MIELPWKRGAAPDHQDVALISATRTDIARARDLPGILIGGLRLRASWSRNPGSIGVRIGVNLLRRVSYSVSTWTSEAALEGFVRSAHHRRVVAPYRNHVEVHAVRWEGECTDRDALWREALGRLGPEPRR